MRPDRLDQLDRPRRKAETRIERLRRDIAGEHPDHHPLHAARHRAPFRLTQQRRRHAGAACVCADEQVLYQPR